MHLRLLWHNYFQKRVSKKGIINVCVLDVFHVKLIGEPLENGEEEDIYSYGGVCFYVRSSVNFIQRKDMSIDDLENLCIQIQKPNSKPFLVATW